MSRIDWRVALPALAGLAVLAGCTDVPGGLGGLPVATSPGTTTTPPAGGQTSPANPTLRGTISGDRPANLRVGMLGEPKAGQAKVELVSAPVTNGSYTLSLSTPPLPLLEPPSENQSIVFALTAYQDVNKNGTFDKGDEELEASASFRWFADDGPTGQYKAGWNVYADGRYSQAFQTAYNIKN